MTGKDIGGKAVDRYCIARGEWSCEKEHIKEDKDMENAKTVYACMDEEHGVWTCGACGYIEAFEADGPAENGWCFCPACGREIEVDVHDAQL